MGRCGGPCPVVIRGNPQKPDYLERCGVRRTSLLVGLFSVLIAGAAWAESPSIELRGFDARAHNVNEYIGHGKWVVVVTWAHDCRICDEEIHHMAEFYQAHKDRDATVLGVSIDGYKQVALARAFVERHKLPFPNLIAEPSQEVMMKFGAGEFVGTPTYYIYNPQGRIVGRNIGPITRKEVEDFLVSETQAVKHDNK
jgi:peroxiredoxin